MESNLLRGLFGVSSPRPVEQRVSPQPTEPTESVATDEPIISTVEPIFPSSKPTIPVDPYEWYPIYDPFIFGDNTNYENPLTCKENIFLT